MRGRIRMASHPPGFYTFRSLFPARFATHFQIVVVTILMRAHLPIGPATRLRSCMAWLLVCAMLAQTGCVQRRLTIRSNPPGALAYVDDYQIGTTPVSTDFVYYGTRK